MKSFTNHLELGSGVPILDPRFVWFMSAFLRVNSLSDFHSTQPTHSQAFEIACPVPFSLSYLIVGGEESARPVQRMGWMAFERHLFVAHVERGSLASSPLDNKSVQLHWTPEEKREEQRPSD